MSEAQTADPREPALIAMPTERLEAMRAELDASGGEDADDLSAVVSRVLAARRRR